MPQLHEVAREIEHPNSNQWVCVKWVSASNLMMSFLSASDRLTQQLFGVPFDEWQMKRRNVENALLKRQQPRTVLFSVTEDGLVKIETSVVLKNTAAIQLAIHGLSKRLSRPTSTEILEKSLNFRIIVSNSLSVK